MADKKDNKKKTKEEPVKKDDDGKDISEYLQTLTLKTLFKYHKNTNKLEQPRN